MHVLCGKRRRNRVPIRPAGEALPHNGNGAHPMHSTRAPNAPEMHKLPRDASQIAPPPKSQTIELTNELSDVFFCFFVPWAGTGNEGGPCVYVLRTEPPLEQRFHRLGVYRWLAFNRRNPFKMRSTLSHLYGLIVHRPRRVPALEAVVQVRDDAVPVGISQHLLFRRHVRLTAAEKKGEKISKTKQTRLMMLLCTCKGGGDEKESRHKSGSTA